MYINIKETSNDSILVCKLIQNINENKNSTSCIKLTSKLKPRINSLLADNATHTHTPLTKSAEGKKNFFFLKNFK